MSLSPSSTNHSFEAGCLCGGAQSVHMPLWTHPTDEFYFLSTPPICKSTITCYWFTIGDHRSNPFSVQKRGFICSLRCQSWSNQPMKRERPCLVGVFVPGVTKMNIPVFTYLSAHLFFCFPGCDTPSSDKRQNTSCCSFCGLSPVKITQPHLSLNAQR